MKKRLKHAAIIIVVVLAVAQLIRPERTNPQFKGIWEQRAN
jgi:hypothetical protein